MYYQVCNNIREIVEVKTLALNNFLKLLDIDCYHLEMHSTHENQHFDTTQPLPAFRYQLTPQAHGLELVLSAAIIYLCDYYCMSRLLSISGGWNMCGVCLLCVTSLNEVVTTPAVDSPVLSLGRE